MSARTLFLTAATLALALPVAVRAELLLDGARLIDGVTVFGDHRSTPAAPGQCYYVPKARIGTRPDGVPDLTFLKYTKTGSGEQHNGGILRFTVGLELEEGEIASLRSKLGKGCATLGPVTFQSGEFLVVSAALGEGGVFTRNIVGQGAAPLLAGSRAAVSIAVTPEGATFLERALRETNHSVDVVFDMTYAGLGPKYEARATIDWDKVRVVTEEGSRRRIYRRRERLLGIWRWIYYVADGDRREQELTDHMSSTGAITVETIGQDERLDPILQTLTEQVMSVIADTQLSLPDEGLPASGEEGEGRDDMPFGSSVTVKDVQRHGKAEINLNSRMRMERQTGPIAADLGEPLRRHGDNERVYRLIDLDDPDFEAQTVTATLDIEGFEDFGAYINYATISFRKRYPGTFSDHTGSLSFNRKSFESSGNLLQWTFPRLGEEGAGWLRYEYKESWSFAGGVTWETGWRTADGPYLALSPPLELRTIDLALDSEQAEAAGIQFVSVVVKNSVRGRERVREVRIQPTDGAWTQHRYYHDENDLEFAYQITWFTTAGRRTSEWRRTTDSFIDLTPRG
jgi:hypothetical protein